MTYSSLICALSSGLVSDISLSRIDYVISLRLILILAIMGLVGYHYCVCANDRKEWQQFSHIFRRCYICIYRPASRTRAPRRWGTTRNSHSRWYGKPGLRFDIWINMRVQQNAFRKRNDRAEQQCLLQATIRTFVFKTISTWEIFVKILNRRI